MNYPFHALFRYWTNSEYYSKVITVARFMWKVQWLEIMKLWLATVYSSEVTQVDKKRKKRKDTAYGTVVFQLLRDLAMVQDIKTWNGQCICVPLLSSIFFSLFLLLFFKTFLVSFISNPSSSPTLLFHSFCVISS